MSATVTIEEAQAHLTELIKKLEPGEELVILENGKPVATLSRNERTIGPHQPSTAGEMAAQQRAQHLAWLKAHREEYAGQYVALDGDRLVGNAATIREAREQARQHGVEHPFLTHISSANEAPFGGW